MSLLPPGMTAHRRLLGDCESGCSVGGVGPAQVVTLDQGRVPSMMTTLSALSRCTTTRGCAARLRALTEPGEVLKQTRPANQTPHTGAACGRPSGRWVTVQ